MKAGLLIGQFLIGGLLLILLTSCATRAPETPAIAPTDTIVLPTSTPLPATDTPIPATGTPVPPSKTPAPASCDEIDGTCLELTFNGESCIYEGPTEIKGGHVTLIFLNESEGGAAANMVRHTGDQTIQDMKDTFVDEPITGHSPSWAVDIQGVWRGIPAGERYVWEGDLQLGIHTLICARMTPPGVWFGGGFTVEE
jgi:hypothetical protein